MLAFGSSLVLFVQALAFNNEDSVHLLFYLSFLVAFAATFLNLTTVISLGLLHMVMGLSLPAFVSDFTLADMLKGPVYFNLVGIAFILMLMKYGQRKQRTDTERLLASEYSYRLLAVEHEMQARWLEDILSATPDHVIVFDQGGRILYANEHVAQVFQRERSDLIHKTWAQLGQDGPMVAQFQGFLKRIFNGEDPITVEVQDTSTGKVCYYVMTISPIHDAYGKVLAAVATRRDITQPKLMQHALEASRERYRIISELISDYAFAFSVEGDEAAELEWMTDSFRRVTGYDWDELMADKDIFRLYHPDDRESVRRDIRRVCAGQVMVGEYRIRTAGGEERWVSIHRRPEVDPDTGRVRRYYGVAQDITERRQAERQRVKLAAEREHMDVIQQFVLAVSHDFRNSLANIETSRYLLHRRLIEPSADEHMLAKSDAIRHNVKHLSEQLDNLSTIFSLKEPANDKVNMSALVQALARQNQLQAEQKGIMLEADVRAIPAHSTRQQRRTSTGCAAPAQQCPDLHP
ncbi:PAS domain S-box protein [bacterium]|nr:PAS domain S-box protein [bacterium]